MPDVTAWATVGLVVVTAGLVWVTWQLTRVTRRNVTATEQAAHAALRQAELAGETVAATRATAEATSEQADISRGILEASVAPFLVPVLTTAADAEAGDVPKAPVVIQRESDQVVITVIFRNFGSGPARIAGGNIVAANHSYHGQTWPMIVGPGEDTKMTVAIDGSEGVTEHYAKGRESVVIGRFTVRMSCWNLPQSTIFTTEMILHPKTLTGLGPHQWDIKVITTPGKDNALIRTMLNEGYIPGVSVDPSNRFRP